MVLWQPANGTPLSDPRPLRVERQLGGTVKSCCVSFLATWQEAVHAHAPNRKGAIEATMTTHVQGSALST